MSDITANSIQIVKKQKIYCIDGWVNALAILLYIDIFLGLLQQQGKQIDGILNNLTFQILILFVIGAIFCILITKFFTFSTYALYSTFCAKYVEKIFPFPFQENYISIVPAHKVKEYAMINNNDVLAKIAIKAEEKEEMYLRNTLTIIGSLYLFCLDLYFKGAYFPIIIPSSYSRPAIVFICAIISMFLLQSLYNRNAQILISSDKLRNQIMEQNKSHIEDD